MGRARKLKQQRKEEEARKERERKREVRMRILAVAGVLAAVGITVGLVILANNLKDREKEPKITSRLVLETTKGEIVIGLYGDEAPLTVQHVTGLAKEGFYDGLRWYRVEEFVVQTGSHYQSLRAEYGEAEPDQAALEEAITRDSEVAKVTDEIGLSNLRGMVGMAKPSDPETQLPEPDSATTDFYILKQDSTFLDAYFTVFGKVIKGMEVVDSLETTDSLLSARVE
ncbi:MAG: peptidylprolyl isomerase [Actinobacteria bacterium]|nr:peptidylprolyl isomerase [Actinomycetota bacterium]